MWRKSYGFKVAGQSPSGSARLAMLGKEFVTTKRKVNQDVDYSKGKIAEAEMLAAVSRFGVDMVAGLATKGEYKRPRDPAKKATAMPMNFYRGTGYGC